MTVPDWAEVPDGMSWDDVPVELKLEEWLGSMQPSIAGWTSHLPRDFRDDYSRDSRVTVEQTQVRMCADPTADLAGSGSLILGDAARYIGEALLWVCSGHWEWADHRALWSDQPVIVPDTVDHLPIAPFVVVTDIVQRRAGNEVTSLWDSLDEQRRARQTAEPGWTPVKTPTPARPGPRRTIGRRGRVPGTARPRLHPLDSRLRAARRHLGPQPRQPGRAR